MDRKRRLVAAALAVVIVGAGAAIAGVATPGGSAGGRRPTSDVGIAGPLGPQAITAFPSYFKRVTFPADQQGQAQEIAAHLPVGRYLVRVIASQAPDGSIPDCMGVSFPLVPPAGTGAGAQSFTGYVSVTKRGDPATVSCYVPAETAPDRFYNPTYELFYVPALNVTS